MITHAIFSLRIAGGSLGKFLCSLAGVCSLLLVSCHSLSAPLLSEPTFTRLSSEQGLSQDTVNSLLLDDSGFLWLGTDGGLNRYDGYHNIQVPGKNNEFSDDVIYYLFQDSLNYLWVSTISTGVYRFDLKTGDARLMVRKNLALQPDLAQVTNHIYEDPSGRIWLTMDEEVVRYTPGSDKQEVVYRLTDEDIQDGAFVRWSWTDGQVLIMALTNGLKGIDLVSGQMRKIDYLDVSETNPDKINAKFLYADEQDTFWVGTVEGLYSLPLQQLKLFIQDKGPLPKPRERVEARNIWRIFPQSEHLFYLATDNGLYSYAPESDQLQHVFRPTDSRDYLARDDLIDLILDKNNNFWLGTRADGALYWSAKSSLFNSVFNARGGREEKILSHNNIWSVHQQGESKLWVGTDNGLNLYNLDDGSNQTYLVSPDSKAQFSEASILQILNDGSDDLWLVTGEGLTLFNSQTGLTKPLNIDKKDQDKTLHEYMWGAKLTDEGDLWFINTQGFYRYSPQTGKVQKLEQLGSTLGVTHSGLEKFLGNLPGQPSKILVTVLSQLWQWDTDTNQLTLIHEIPKQGQLNQTAADSWAIDKNNILWIAYPGYGLVGIDADSYQQRYFFNKDNLLPTNSIYALQLDKSGNIWMSSHAGLLKFYPESQALQRFGHAEGLTNFEYNQGAGTALRDGRLVYGSPKGFTLFDPNEFNVHNEQKPKVSITAINLSSSPLNLPYSNLDGQSIELQHDDVGLSINFSTLEFEYQNNTRYRYKLIGASDLEYPITRDPQVTFPRFAPGHYRFEVTAFDASNGMESPPASINIQVHYAPYASPLAYTMYAIVVLALFGLFWRRRLIHNQRLYEAHRDTVRSKNRLTQALTASNSNIWEWQSSTNLFYAPRIVEELNCNELGKEVDFEEHLQRINPQDQQQYLAKWQRFLSQQDVSLDVTYRMQTRHGDILWYRDIGSIVSDNNNSEILVTGTYTNVTESIADQEKLRLFGEAYRHTRDWVVICNSQKEVLAANEAFYEAFGINSEETLLDEVKHIYDVQLDDTALFWHKFESLSADEFWSGEDKVALDSGRICNVIVFLKAVASVHDQESIEYYLVVMSDITEQKEAEQKLRRLASYDSLTGLPNRALLLDRIQHAIDHAARYRKSVAVLFIDLDRFKSVNDTLGHKAGDQLLTIIAQRLTQLLRQDDTVARLGGDEFVVVVEDVQDPDRLSSVASQIIKVIDTPIQLGNQTVSVSSSIGIAVYPDDAANSEQLLRNSDIAMYHAKESGRNNFQYFTEHMNNMAQARLILENQLKEAQQDKQFENYYQPIVDITAGKVVGFELLMRWPTPDGMIPPDKFIPVSEELGLIEDMTWDAILRAIPMLCQWQKEGFTGYLSVNLSARHFEGKISIEKITQLLKDNSLPISVLRFEITESALMKDYEKALHYMQQMQEQGYAIALDDFGTGYSSLKYLKEFPINVIKVDKSFVDDIGKNQNNEAIILTTLRMAESLQLYCIAEGIEDIQQAEFFKQHGCDYLQGYYFSKPVPVEETYALLQKHWSI